MYIAVYIAVKRVYKKRGGGLAKINYTNFWTCTKKNGLGIRTGFQMYFVFKIQGKDTSPIYLHSHVFGSGYGLQRIFFFNLKLFLCANILILRETLEHTALVLLTFYHWFFFLFLTEVKWCTTQHYIYMKWCNIKTTIIYMYYKKHNNTINIFHQRQETSC